LQANESVQPTTERDSIITDQKAGRENIAKTKDESEQLADIAQALVPGAIPKPTQTGNGIRTFGLIVGITENFVVQQTGRNDFKTHHKNNLPEQKIEIGKNVEIVYKEGKGIVKNRALGQDKVQSQSR